ncbi:hypothetical protein [Pedobacter sp. MR2016-24]|uniref:hypothetical protein n=1 Tax=Pedobacter sp. MR2016-24 TaxID=2994466 RepID=UPI00224606C8|nr:hypothetical protein [Pedobacter sp. MR2016-24]MCX2484522.1 hypothetical protein [Pedobacter sp. MR2016-24]
MAKAEILKNGKVVRSDNFTNEIRHDLEGFLIEFSIENLTYIYREITHFKTGDIQSNKITSGYYQKLVFLNYIAGIESLEKVKNTDSSKEGKIVYATKGDNLAIRKLLIPSLPYKGYCEVSSYKFLYDGDLTKVLNDDLSIRIPQEVEADLETVELHIQSSIFLKNRMVLASTFADVEQNSAALLITKIALVISMINKDIFPLFDNGTSEEYKNYALKQNEFWQTGLILDFRTLNDLDSYLNNIRRYYRNTYVNQLLITQSNGKDKLYWLAKSLSPITLSIIPPKQRIDILEVLALKSSLDDDNQEYALNIVNSVDISNQSEVNEFLGALISKKYVTNSKLPPYTNNLYSLLYIKIVNHLSILKSTFEMIGSNKYSKDNRTRFATAILLLWQESKYNPYKNLTTNGEPDYSLIDDSTYDYDKNFNHFALINYNSRKSKFGVYNDNFTFEFDPNGNGIYWITANKDFTLSAATSLNLYQPMTLLSYPSETDTSIQLPQKDGEFKGVVPLFFLAFIDSDGDSKDFDTKVGIMVDVAATFSGIGAIAELRYIRYLSKLGQFLVIIDTVSIAASILSFLLRYSEDCNNSPFCEKLRTVLFYIEIISLVKDPIAIAKSKKAAQNLVEEGIESGWPSGMLNEIDGFTPKQKIEQLAGMDIADYLKAYVSDTKSTLIQIINRENAFLKTIGAEHSLVKYYSDFQMEEILTYAAGKGLSKEDGMGILHQACRKRPVEFIAPINLLKDRMDRLVAVRKRGFPFTFSSLDSFDDYANNKIGVTLDKFGLAKDKVYYTGSSITSESSISGGIFDTDWSVNYSYIEMEKLVGEMEKRFIRAHNLGIIKKGKANEYNKAMKSFFKKNRVLHKRYIVAIEDGHLVNIRQVIDRDFPDVIKSDITPVLEDLKAGYPRIKYKFK